MYKKYKVAIIHDWLTDSGGAEKVLARFLNIFPHADIFSVVDFFPEKERNLLLGGRHAKTTFIQKIPYARRFYRSLLPLMPFAIEQLNLTGYDIIISSSYAVAKGVICGPDQLHVSYVHSPMRYAWDMQFQYLKESGLEYGFKGILAKYFLHKLRIWDVRTSVGIDYIVANSNFVARRIKKTYGRSSNVIYPPVDVKNFLVGNLKEDFYLTASRMVPYKRIPLIVEAFSKMPDKKLIVIGDGPDFQKCKSLCTDNIKLLGYQEFRILIEYMQKAKAFIFAAEEDFGIAPVEAQACGTPVIAYGKGGALETIVGNGELSSRTGLFFYEQSVEAICSSVMDFELNGKFSPDICRKNAENFSEDNFDKNFIELLDSAINKSFS